MRVRGATASTVLIITGMKMPVPTACTRRAARKSGQVGASMAATSPRVRKPAAVRNSVRRRSRLVRKADTVTTMAVTIM